MEVLRFAASLLLFVVLQDSTRAYPHGPPPSTCLTLYPKHGADPQTGVAPYRLVFSSATYRPGQTLSLRVTSTNNSTFKGFMLTAHRVSSSGNTEEYVGTFNATDNATQTLTCLGAKQVFWNDNHAVLAEINEMIIVTCCLNRQFSPIFEFTEFTRLTTEAALGHSNATGKTMVNTTWTAPNKNVGDVQFILTVVQREVIFWYRIPFTLQAETAEGVIGPNYTCQQQKPQTGQNARKPRLAGWYQEPNNANCTGQDCRAALSYRKVDDKFVFEMSLKKQDNYIAVGFSDDKLMGDDHTVMCTANSGHASVQEGHNVQLPTYKFSNRQFTRGVSDLVVGQVDGRTYCKFTAVSVLRSVVGNMTRPFDLNKQYYLFLAWGPVYNDTDVMGKHNDAPAISTAKVNLTEYSTRTVTSTAFKQLISCSLMAAALVLACLLQY